MKQYELYELCFHGEAPKGSHVAVQLSVTFSNESEKKTVKGFYAGNGVYKARFYPQYTGIYTWKADSEIPFCEELHGYFECHKATGKNCGMIRAVDTHFEFDGGAYFCPFGTTIYALAHQEESLIRQTFHTLQSAPFNKVRHCVFPKDYDYNKNEPSLYPFEKGEDGKWDVHCPCFAFWDHLEKIILRLSAIGIQSDLILFHPYDRWGFGSMTREENLVYLDYLLRRLSAIPGIWWSLSNEFDLCFSKTMEDWHVFEAYVSENDPYHHLLSNHNCFSFYDFTRPAVTHCCLQSNQMIRASEWRKKYQKPVVYDEICYEGNLPQNWGNISGFELTNRFWMAYVQGTYATHGEVFLSDDDILWWSKGGVLKGQSHKRIAFLKKVMEEIGEPLEEWAVNPLEGMDPEFIQTILNSPFALLPQQMPLDQQEAHLFTDTAFRGRVADRVFLQYLGIHCNGVLDLHLPEDKSYRVEVLDVWEMTRKTVLTGAAGRIQITLPGKEGIAVLATAEEVSI